jgi:hypothetical protein
MKVRSDGFSRFVRLGAWAAIVSGAALVAAHLMQWLVVPYERSGTAAYLTGSYLVSASLSLLASILLIWALIGLYAPQSRAAGTFGLWSFILAFCGAALNLGNNWAELFVWPTLALVAPGRALRKGNRSPLLSGEWHQLVGPAVGHRRHLVRDCNVYSACVSALGCSPINRFYPGHHRASPHARDIPGVDRPDLVRHRLRRPRLARHPEADTVKGRNPAAGSTRSRARTGAAISVIT